MRALFPALIACSISCAVYAQETDEVVRLPSPGGLKHETPVHGEKPSRLVPAGGLFLSFDANHDGRISGEELNSGISQAFHAADASGDGALTALEQQDWASRLPTHDDTLANPVRFDPNLDRMVSPTEFRDVIVQLAADYAEPSGDILLVSLQAPKIRSERRPEEIEDARQTRPPRRTDTQGVRD